MSQVEAQVGGGQSAAPRPPTVVIDEDNVRHLQKFPRPPKDNGIGLHFHIDLRDQFIEESVQHLKEVRATWTLIYAQDELQAERAARACFEANIMPVVRIGALINTHVEPAPFISAVRRAWQSAGWGGPVEPIYIQLMNEPEDIREWLNGDKPGNWADQFGSRWAEDAPKIVGEGGFVGIQVLDRPGFDRAVDMISARGQDAIWKHAFFAHHNYGQNHPPAYPYDDIKQQTDPGKTILEDHVAALRFLAHAAWLKERIGFVPPIIGGEGGWWPGNEEDKHYPKVDWTLHAQYTREMFEWLRTGILSNGEPTPDYLFSITAWIISSWTFPTQNWWGNFLSPTGRLDETIAAMKAIPEFVRRFSWDGPNPTPDEGSGSTPPPGGGTEPPPVGGHEPPPGGGDEPPPNPDPGPGPAPNPPPLAVDWDPRLSELGVRLEPAGDGARWRLVKAEFRDEAASEGKHHIYVKAVRAGGEPAAGVPFVADWPDRQPQDLPVRGTTGFDGETNLPMFIPFDPIRKDGKMFATVEGARADVVAGMGLPFNHHVCFVLTYREL